MAFDTTRLVQQIKITGGLAQGRFADSELLDLAYDYMLSELVPMVITKREEFYGRSHDDSMVAGTAAYPMFPRALGGNLRAVTFPHINDDGIDRPERVTIDDIRVALNGTPDRVYPEGGNIILYPTPDSGAAASLLLRQHYFIRPSKFVQVSECGRITAIDPLTRTVTLTIPSDWSTADTFDLLRAKGKFDPLSIDLEASSVAGGQITFTTDLPDNLEVGDYVALSEETCFPTLPIEGHAALVWGTIAIALTSMNHPRADAAMAKAASSLKTFTTLISIRIQGAQKPWGRRFL